VENNEADEVLPYRLTHIKGGTSQTREPLAVIGLKKRGK